MDNQEYRTGYATQSQDSVSAVDFADLKTQMEDLKKELSEIKQFRDDLKYNNGLNNNDLKIDSGRKFITGPAMFTNGVDTPEATSAIISTGRDRTLSSGVENTQVTLLRVEGAQSFFYGLGGNIVNGSDGSFSSGGSVLSSSLLSSIEDNSLVGTFVTVIISTGSAISYQITANSGNSITVNSSFPETNRKVQFLIFDPINLGGWEYPWRRLYVFNGSGGGIQFGGGTPQNGQNGLLYDNGTNLIYRKPNGTLITLA